MVRTGAHVYVKYGWEGDTYGVLDATGSGQVADKKFGLQDKMSSLTLTNNKVNLAKLNQNTVDKFAYGQQQGTASMSFTLSNPWVLGTILGAPTKAGSSPFTYTYPATAEAVVLAGGIPVLVDVDLDSMNMTSEILDEAYNENMTVFSPVSWAGVPLESEIYKKAKNLNLKMLEDSACSLGAKIGEEFVGKIADFSCFSFYPRKVITTGEGGMITTDDDEMAEKCYSYKHFGAKGASFETIGTNYKMSNILSAIGLVQMKKIENIIQIRNEKAKIYHELI